MKTAKPLSAQTSAHSFNDQSSVAPDPLGHSKTDELFLAASELGEATKSFFDLLTQTRLTKSNFLEHSAELLAVYDEYLEVLDHELDSTGEPTSPETEITRSDREELTRLHVTFDYHRELLAGVCKAVEQQLSDGPQDEIDLSSLEPVVN